MSTDWGIGCRTCRDAGAARDVYFSGEWDGCRDVDGLRRLIEARRLVVGADDALGPFRARFFWGQGESSHASGVAHFFRTHFSHSLAPMNEYGEFCDETSSATDEIECPSCGKTNSSLHDRTLLVPLAESNNSVYGGTRCAHCGTVFVLIRETRVTYRARREWA